MGKEKQILKEKDLEVYTLWESPNGNLFFKVSDEYSIAIGPKGDHNPHEQDLKNSQYIKQNNVFPVKIVGKIKI